MHARTTPHAPARLALILWLGLGLAACGSSGGGKNGPVGAVDGGQDTGKAPSDASGDGSAADAGSTDPGGPEPECSEAKACPSGKLCDCKGSCADDPGTKACTEDKNCGSGSYCDPCLGRCFEQLDMCAPCSLNQQCRGNGARCLLYATGDSFCGRACETSIGCKDGSHPKGVGFECTKVPGLKTRQCAPASGSCDLLVGCTKDKECPALHFCNADLGQCAKGCTDDKECPVEKICSALRCQDACDDATNPCPVDFECRVDGRCKRIGGCDTWVDCPEPETHCDEASKLCQPGCVVDEDCKTSKKVCKDSKCVDRPCEGNIWCAFGQVCSETSGKCEKAQGPFCATCDPQGDHEAQCGPGGFCLSVEDEDGNKGDFCGPACGAGPTDRCPKGYGCNEVQDQDGKVLGEICFRDCFYDPLGK